MLQTDFDKPVKEKVFHVESGSLGVTQIELSQHNTVQITKHPSKDGCYCITKVLVDSCIGVLQKRYLPCERAIPCPLGSVGFSGFFKIKILSTGTVLD